MRFRNLMCACTSLLASVALYSQPSPAANFDVQKLADNVYAVVRKEPPGLMVDANNLLIVRDRDVVVVDSNGAPVITREVLGALRKITNKPVRYVINTHYHDDHVRGNQVYRDAFPAVDFIAHSFARDYLPNQGAANRKAFLEGAPQFASQLRGLIKEGKNLLGGEMSVEERESLSSDVALADVVLRDGASAETVLPTITVDDRMTLPGQPVIDVMHVGKGHTAADVIVHLPALHIVATGDLVVWPVPLVGDPQSHIGSWSSALDAIRALKPSAILPGHGPVLRNDEYLATLSSMFADIQRQVAAAKARGETLEQARKSVNLDAFRTRLTGDSPVRRLLFSMYVTRPAVGAAYAQVPRGILLH